MRIGTVLRPLEDRKGTLGGVNRAVLVGPAKRLAQLPDLSRRALSRIQLGLDGVTEMDWSNVDKQTPQDAARTWMKADLP